MAREAAELIYAESQSGSASWDELNGPDSEIQELPDGSYRVLIPEGWDDSDPESSKRWCIIAISMAETKPR
jgi:hypothetical protein